MNETRVKTGKHLNSAWDIVSLNILQLLLLDCFLIEIIETQFYLVIMDLNGQILLQIEDYESGYGPNKIIINGYTNEHIFHHIIIIDGGLGEGIDVSSMQSSSPQARARRLTWLGHGFIDAAR
jgi:hypothetical protein